MRSRQAPDFIPDRDLAAGDRAFRRYNDEDYEQVKQWGDYAAKQQSTTHFLERCLNQCK